MIDVRHYEHGDLDRIDLREYAENTDFIEKRIERGLQFGIVYTFENDKNDVVSIVGADFRGAQIVEVWAALSDKIKETPVQYHRLVVSLLKELWEKVGSLHRMQAIVKDECARNVKWVRSLGFEKEGILRKYGENGENYAIYSRVR